MLALNNGQRDSQYLQNRPIAVFDSEYECAPLIKATADEPRPIKAMRIRSHRCLWSAPLSYSGRGRPKIHGNQFKLNDSRQMVEEQTLESLQPKQRKNPAQKMG